MSEEVAWLLELEVREGQEADLRAVMADMISSAQENEPDTKNYEWSFSADGKTCHIYERYADSDAVMKHLKTFGDNFAQKFLSSVVPTRFTVYGEPNQTVKQALTGFSPSFMTGEAGFVR